jgi:hypothetical protein
MQRAAVIEIALPATNQRPTGNDVVAPVFAAFTLE